jgi:hypothetical protein
MSANENYLFAFVDYVTLTYHEARNVRHLIKERRIHPRRYERLVNLPRKREDAWKALQDSRGAAKKAGSARGAEAVFEERFGVGLEDLEVLFQDENWKHSKLGGNRWASVTRAVIDLRDAIDQQDVKTAAELVEGILCMRHNTDGVKSKLTDLDRSL